MAATLITSADDIGFTILPYTPLERSSIQKELSDHPTDHALGFVTRDKETSELKFTYTESGGLTEAEDHWSLAILKEFPYYENNGPWIVYNCSPRKAKTAFGAIVSKYAQALHIYGWDTWSVAGKKGTVAVITSWEIY